MWVVSCIFSRFYLVAILCQITALVFRAKSKIFKECYSEQQIVYFFWIKHKIPSIFNIFILKSLFLVAFTSFMSVTLKNSGKYILNKYMKFAPQCLGTYVYT